MRKLQAFLPRQSLVTIYIYGFYKTPSRLRDIIYDQTNNNSFHQKMDSVQYNAALAITGAIRGTSREKLFQELGLESDCKRQLYRKLCYFFKIFKGQSPEYLFRILPNVSKA